MTLFTIDTDRCDNDGLCAADCPAQIIDMTDAGPAVKTGGEAFCIDCGHCVAICPKGAFTLNTLAPADCMPIDRKTQLDETQTEHFLRARRSIRQYKAKPIPRDLMNQVLELAASAPTGSNRQSTRWLVMEKKKDVQVVAGHVIDWMRYVIANHPEVAQNFNMDRIVDQWENGKDRITRNAPMLVFVYADKANGSGAADCHTALAYLELAMPGFGLGSCWAGYVNYAAGQWPPLTQMINLPEGHAGHGALMVGYPGVRYARAPKRNEAQVTYF